MHTNKWEYLIIFESTMWMQWNRKSKFTHIFIFQNHWQILHSYRQEKVPNLCSYGPKNVSNRHYNPCYFSIIMNYRFLTVLHWFYDLQPSICDPRFYITPPICDPTVEPSIQSWKPSFWEDFNSCVCPTMNTQEVHWVDGELFTCLVL